VNINNKGNEEGGICTVYVKNEDANYKGGLEM